MNELRTQLHTLLTLMGFEDPGVEVNEEYRKVSLILDDNYVRENILIVLSAFEHLVNLMVRKQQEEYAAPYVVDVNFYRKERERLISELARAAAKKALMTKQEVELPAMNAYERRLVHMEITTHPELKTESMGTGKERRVIIKRLE